MTTMLAPRGYYEQFVGTGQVMRGQPGLAPAGYLQNYAFNSVLSSSPWTGRPMYTPLPQPINSDIWGVARGGPTHPLWPTPIEKGLCLPQRGTRTVVGPNGVITVAEKAPGGPVLAGPGGTFIAPTPVLPATARGAYRSVGEVFATAEQANGTATPTGAPAAPAARRNWLPWLAALAAAGAAVVGGRR